MLQGSYANSSVSCLSLDQSNQSDSPNGKITPPMLYLWWQDRHCLIKFCKCPTVVSISPHEAKALLELFCLQANVFGWKQNRSSSAFASWGLIKMHDLQGRIRTGSVWGFSVRVQSWSNKIEFDPVLIRKFFENLQSDPVLIRSCTSVERIGNFCDPNSVQYFHCVIQSHPNSVVLP